MICIWVSYWVLIGCIIPGVNTCRTHCDRNAIVSDHIWRWSGSRCDRISARCKSSPHSVTLFLRIRSTQQVERSSVSHVHKHQNNTCRQAMQPNRAHPLSASCAAGTTANKRPQMSKLIKTFASYHISRRK